VLFLAFYELALANLDAAVAKRLEWDVAAPESMKILGEWVQHGSSERVKGCVVFETDDPGDLQTLVLYYGTTVAFDVRPASDVKTALERTREQLGKSG
jgi:hypothetical protein